MSAETDGAGGLGEGGIGGAQLGGRELEVRGTEKGRRERQEAEAVSKLLAGGSEKRPEVPHSGVFQTWQGGGSEHGTSAPW